MAGNQGSKVSADLKRNRLIITVSATASQKEAKKIYTDIRFCVADLQPGFDVITDSAMHKWFAYEIRQDTSPKE